MFSLLAIYLCRGSLEGLSAVCIYLPFGCFLSKNSSVGINFSERNANDVNKPLRVRAASYLLFLFPSMRGVVVKSIVFVL